MIFMCMFCGKERLSSGQELTDGTGGKIEISHSICPDCAFINDIMQSEFLPKEMRDQDSADSERVFLERLSEEEYAGERWVENLTLPKAKKLPEFLIVKERIGNKVVELRKKYENIKIAQEGLRK